MRTPGPRRALASLALAAALGAAVPARVAAAPSDDRVLPADQYTSEKARGLAAAHDGALRALNAYVYHCLPWVEVQRHSIGFFKPRHVDQDERYLSVRIYVEQEPSPEFAALPLEQRASSMFSRYAGALLRQMAREHALLNDPAVAGFAVLLEWQKQGVRGVGQRPVHETIAAFMDKPLVLRYLAGVMPVRELAARARVLAWDGERQVGQLRIAGWDDDFVGTYKVKNYQLAQGVRCQ
jgi:hypothetical protein